jgi:hypothetical protein
MLRDANVELDRLRQENTRLMAAQVDSNELNRLLAGHRELMRLRAEVARLRAGPGEMAEVTETGLAPVPEEPLQAATRLPPMLFRAELRASVPMGSTLATGGWMTAAGRYSIVLLTPELMGEAEGERQVLVTTTFAEAPEEVWRQCGLMELTTESAAATDGILLKPEEAQRILGLLKETDGVDVLASPRVGVIDGNQGRIASFGPSQLTRRVVEASADFIPRLSPDGQMVDLTILAELGERDFESTTGDAYGRP